MSEHQEYMKAALEEAQKAYDKMEVPIGAVVVKDGLIVGRGHNLRESGSNGLYHAEMMAMDAACKYLKAWRLSDCDLYVTIEPCPMCAGAMIQSRIRKVFFGSLDAKGGAVVSVIKMLDIDRFNHQVLYEQGLMQEECRQIMTQFFRALRQKKRLEKENRRLDENLRD